jgi:hypothetical protein
MSIWHRGHLLAEDGGLAYIQDFSCVWESYVVKLIASLHRGQRLNIFEYSHSSMRCYVYPDISTTYAHYVHVINIGPRYYVNNFYIISIDEYHVYWNLWSPYLLYHKIHIRQLNLLIFLIYFLSMHLSWEEVLVIVA